MHVEVYLHILLTVVKCKVKIHSRSSHDGPEGEYRFSSTLSLTSGLGGVGGQCHAQAPLPPFPGLYLVPIVQEAGGPQGWSGWM